ncbi:MAG: alanine racemase, partial [Armatimonadetes bacterium]|nr:alanine racemase [Armatimonadota bacterium]
LLKKGRPYVMIHDRPAPIIGRVAAQMCCVDVSAIPEVKAGDTVKLPARRTLVSPDVPRIADSSST